MGHSRTSLEDTVDFTWVIQIPGRVEGHQEIVGTFTPTKALYKLVDLYKLCKEDKHLFPDQLKGFKTRPSSVQLCKGDPLRLHAELLGHPPPRVTWLKDGIEIKNDDSRFKIDSSGHNHTLTAPSVTQARIFVSCFISVCLALQQKKIPPKGIRRRIYAYCKKFPRQATAQGDSRSRWLQGPSSNLHFTVFRTYSFS